MTGDRERPDSPDRPDPPADVTVEPATADDRLDVLRVLDAAMLETDADAVDERTAAGDALVARSERTGGVVGALVAARPEAGRFHVDAVAVRRARRGRGIGSALVAAAVERGERADAVAAVTAVFDPELRPFYAALGFEVRPADGSEGPEAAASGDADRLFGHISTADSESP